jgi:alpha/beta superfamily hydrolase
MVHVDNAYKFDKEIGNHTLKIIDGANHNFNGVKYHEVLVDAILSFINEKHL